MSEWGRAEKLEGLYVCVGMGRVDVLEEALREGYDFRAELYNGESVVTVAAEHGLFTLRRVYELLKTVDVPDDLGYTALLSAVCCNEADQVAALLELGASTEHRCTTGQNALHFAAADPEGGPIARLLARYASLSALLAHDTDLCGDTPITLAADKGHLEQASVYCDRLIELGGPLDLKVGPKTSPVCYYLKRAGAHDLVEKLLKAGASANYEPEE